LPNSQWVKQSSFINPLKKESFMNVQTQSVHFNADYKLIQIIEGKMNKLERFFDRILSANVILKLENSGQIRDKIVEIKLTLPGSVLFVKESSKTFEQSLDSAAAVLRRQLIKHKEQLRLGGR